MDLQQIIPGTLKQGYLTKSPPLDKGGIKNWKKRFCILYRSGKELYLQYYENYDAAMTTLPKDVVALQGCLGISQDLDHKSHKHLFSIQLPHRTYYFSASSEPDMRDWVDICCKELGFSKPGETPHSRASGVTSPVRPLPPVPTEDLPIASPPLLTLYSSPTDQTSKPRPPSPPPRNMHPPFDPSYNRVKLPNPVSRDQAPQERQQIPPPLPPRILYTYAAMYKEYSGLQNGCHDCDCHPTHNSTLNFGLTFGAETVNI